MRWYRLAAEQGHNQAQYNLGVAYQTGDGVIADPVLALMWFSIAAANGHIAGADWLEKQAARMTPADTSEAQRNAQVCMESGYQECD
jgi:uncharacterized protein